MTFALLLNKYIVAVVIVCRSVVIHFVHVRQTQWRREAGTSRGTWKGLCPGGRSGTKLLML